MLKGDKWATALIKRNLKERQHLLRRQYSPVSSNAYCQDSHEHGLSHAPLLAFYHAGSSAVNDSRGEGEGNGWATGTAFRDGLLRFPCSAYAGRL